MTTRIFCDFLWICLCLIGWVSHSVSIAGVPNNWYWIYLRCGDGYETADDSALAACLVQNHQQNWVIISVLWLLLWYMSI